MKKKKQNDITASIRMRIMGENLSQKQKRLVFMADTLVLWVLLLLFARIITSGLGFSVNAPVMAFVLLVYATLLQFVGGSFSRLSGYMGLILAGIWLLAFVVMQKLLGDGIRMLANDVMAKIGTTFPRELPVFQVTVGEEAKRLYETAGFLWCMAPVSMLMRFLMQRRYKKKLPEGSASISRMEVLLAACLMLAAGVLVYSAAVPKSRYHAPAAIERLQEAVKESIHNIRFGSDKDALTDGDFTAIGKTSRTDEGMLEVTMEQPGSYYLRGFVGGNYTGTGFERTSGETLWEEEGLFYWLHEKGFYGQEMLALSAEKLLGEEEGVSENKITVNVINGSSEYIYTPYELTESEESLSLRKKRLGDEGIVSGGFQGETSYEYQAVPSAISKALLIAGKMADENALSEDGKNYQLLEGYYNEFVYQNYLGVADMVKTSLKKHLKEDGWQTGEDHADYGEVKEKIVYLLNKECTYEGEKQENWNGLDFVTEFLDGTKTGGDHAFAAAATILFRYYGIPARYAEGYLVTKTDAALMKAGEGYLLTGKAAHAWTEYYQDGVGWLPFEVIPSYMDQMEKIDEYQAFSSLSRGGGSEDENNNDETEEEEDEEEEAIDWLFVLEIVLIVAIIFVLLFILGLFIWVIVKRQQVKKQKALFDDPDTEKAIRAMFSYTMNLLAVSGMKIRNTSLYRYGKPIGRVFGEEMAQEFEEVVDIRQEAVYSQHPIEEEKRKKVKAFEEKIWQGVYEEGTLLQRLKLKFVYYL